MDNLYCAGGESNLTDCRFDGWGLNDCQDSEAAGVVCKSGPVSRLGVVATTSATTTTPRPTTAAPATTPKVATALSTTAYDLHTLSGRKVQSDMAARLRIKVIDLNYLIETDFEKVSFNYTTLISKHVYSRLRNAQ